MTTAPCKSPPRRRLVLGIFAACLITQWLLWWYAPFPDDVLWMEFSSFHNDVAVDDANHSHNHHKTCVLAFHNSPHWLEARHGNIPDGSSIVPPEKDSLKTVLQQSLCHEQSAFRNPVYWTDNNKDHVKTRQQQETFQQQWIFRLAYWGIHLHQHNPARREIQERRHCSDDQVSQKEIGLHDYECPDTKFFITDIPPFGVGADIRLGVVPTLIAGLAMNRTVVLMSGVPALFNTSRILVPKWPLAKCPNRPDYQCFFLPLSPCVPSIKDLQQAVVLPDTQATLQVQEHAAFADPTWNDARVVVMPSQAKLPRMRPETLERAGTRIQELLVEHLENENTQTVVPQHILQLLSNGTNLLYRPQGAMQGAYDEASLSILNAAALLYIFRLNSNFDGQVNRVTNKVVPPDLSTQHSFGMPIRASDKCGMESACLSFDMYMELVLQQRQTYYDDNDKHIVMDILLTSESEQIMESRNAWENRTDFPFRFVVNDEDVTQGSGWPGKYGDQANAIMVSTFVALKMQLLSRHLVANCCSRFHEVLVDLFKFGCGASSRENEPSVHCMQELEDKQFRLCCRLPGFQNDPAHCQSSNS